MRPFPQAEGRLEPYKQELAAKEASMQERLRKVKALLSAAEPVRPALMFHIAENSYFKIVLWFSAMHVVSHRIWSSI